MKKGFLLLFVFVFSTSLSQNLEESIYVATESFQQHQNHEGLETLNVKISQFESQLNTKDDYYAFINLLVNKAYYLSKINRQTEAIKTYEKAHQLYINHEITSYDIVEYALIPLGILYHKTNSYIKAEQMIRYYIQLAEKYNNHAQQISGYINLAKLYQSLYKHKQVIEIANKGLQIDGLKKYQERRLNSIKRKSERLIEINQNHFLLENDLVGPRFDIGKIEQHEMNYEVALKKGDYDKAYSYLNRLKNLKINPLTSARNRAKFSFQEAQLHFLRNENDKAIVKLKNSLSSLLPNFETTKIPTTEDLYPENTFIDIFDLWAEIESNPEKALHYYDLSFYVTQKFAQENTDQESYILSASINKDRSEKCISLLYDLYQVKGKSAYAKRAFAYAELNKALALKWYSSKKQLLEEHPNDSLLIEEQHLLKQQQHYTNKLLNRPINRAQLIERDSLQLQLISTGLVLKQLQDSIQKKYNLADLNTLNTERLRAKLEKDQACLVEYFSGKNGLYQFVFSPLHIDFQHIELSNSMQTKISKFINYFEKASTINNNITAFTEDAFHLYEALKLQSISPYKNTIIVADGLLNFIPFESLLTQSTSTSNYSEMPFMVQSHRIVYHTSALFYTQSKPYRFKDSALGVFPVFDNTNLKLKYSLDEADRIDDEIQTEFLMYEAATKQGVLERAKDYSILHLSTHANSGDFKIAANIDFIDSKLYLQDLYQLDLKNDLVVLSACETGVGMLQKGEGSMNLARGFKYAGVPNMVVSLWKINDLSTSQLMSSFYRELRKTESAFVANQNSKLAYLEHPDISNIKKSPYYWSAFVYFGDLTPAKSSPSIPILIYCIIGLIVGLLIWILITKRKTWKP